MGPRRAVQETVASLRRVVANRALLRVNAALAGSLIGDWAYATAVVVWAYQDAGAAGVGIWGVVRLGSLALVTPLAATLADRFPRTTVMVSSDLVRAAVVLGAAWAVLTEQPSLLVYALATLAPLVGAPFRPAQMALLPSLVDSPEELTAANGVGSTLESLAFFIGPAIGGLLVAVASIPVVFAFNAATFVWSALLVMSIGRVTRPSDSTEAGDEPDRAVADDPAPPPEVAGPGGVSEALAGFRVLWSQPDLRLVTVLYCAQTVVAGASIVFEVAMAVDLLGLGPQGVGYLDSVMGVGALAGGLLAVALGTRGRLASDFGVAVMFWALPLVLITIWPAAAPAFLAMLLIGVANPIADVNASTMLQRLVPDAVLGRVFGALDAAILAAMALGSLIMPALIALVGLRWSLAVLAAPVVAVSLAAMPRLRRMDERLRPPEHVDVLRDTAIFAPLLESELEAVATQLQEIRVAAGTTVLTEGDEGDRFYLLEDGEADVIRRSELINHLTPGDCFGEIALLRDVPRTASVVATRDCTLQALTREQFLDVVANPEVRTRADALAARRQPTY